jgi:hypothetical protein
MPAIDEFASHAAGATASADRVFAITPHDTNELTYVTRAIRTETGGVVRLVPRAGGDPVDCNFADGETRPIRARKVLATGTTATGIEGMS